MASLKPCPPAARLPRAAAANSVISLSAPADSRLTSCGTPPAWKEQLEVLLHPGCSFPITSVVLPQSSQCVAKVCQEVAATSFLQKKFEADCLSRQITLRIATQSASHSARILRANRALCVQSAVGPADMRPTNFSMPLADLIASCRKGIQGILALLPEILPDQLLTTGAIHPLALLQISLRSSQDLHPTCFPLAEEPPASREQVLPCSLHRQLPDRSMFQYRLS